MATRGRWSVTFMAVFAGLVVAACGGTGAPGSDDASDRSAPSEEPSPVGGWAVHELGPGADDTGIAATSIAGAVVALTVSDRGDGRDVVRAHRVEEGEGAEEAPVEGASAELRTVTAVVDGPAGLVAVGVDVVPDARAFVLRSADGAGWEEVETSGLDLPVEVAGLVATPDGYVAVGAFRTGERPLAGGFSPAILTSPDGMTWASAPLPADGGGSLHGVAVAGADLLAVGFVGGDWVAWRSSDGGATWRDDPAVPAAAQMAGDGDVVVTARSLGEDQVGLALQRSVDGGATWERVDAAFTEALSSLRLSHAGSGFALVASRAVPDPFTSIEVCYADIDRCRSSANDDVIFLSDDGAWWNRLDLSGLDELAQATSVVRDGAGGTAVLGVTVTRGWAAWTWEATSGPVPTIDEGEQEAPAYDGPPIVRYGATLVEGERYASPLWLHCGGGHLGAFNDTDWGLVAGADLRLDAGAGDATSHREWLAETEALLGFVTLVAEDRIEYSLTDGEVVAAYEPIPSSDVEPCY